jgi:hypothetical protein
MQNPAYLISSTPNDPGGRTKAHAFTLVEIMMGAGLGAFILGGVLTTFVMIGRVLTNAGNYSDLDAEARQGIETFGREVRSASYVNSGLSATQVELTIPSPNGQPSYNVTYEYVPDPNNPGQYIFQRNGPPLADPYLNSTTVANPAPTTLVHNVQPGSFTFQYFLCPASTISQIQAGQGGDNYTINAETPLILSGLNANVPTDLTTIKQIEVDLTAQRSNVTVVNATNVVLSACFTLRNN